MRCRWLLAAAVIVVVGCDGGTTTTSSPTTDVAQVEGVLGCQLFVESFLSASDPKASAQDGVTKMETAAYHLESAANLKPVYGPTARAVRSLAVAMAARSNAAMVGPLQEAQFLCKTIIETELAQRQGK